MRPLRALAPVAVLAAVIAGCAAPSGGGNPVPTSTTSTTTTSTTVADPPAVVAPDEVPPTTEPTPEPTPAAPPSTTVPEPSVERGTHIIYSAKASATFQLFKMKADGTQRVRLTDDSRFEHHWPRPSPDGERVLFYRAAIGQTVNDIETNSLWSMAPDGSDKRELIPRGAYGWTRQGHAEWSPDGTKIVMAAGAADLELWVTDADGTNPRRLLERKNVVGAKATAIDPSWAPDGRTVVFTGCPRDLIFCFPWNYEVFSYDTATGVEKRLTNDNIPDFDPYVSPDGSKVVWLRCTGLFPVGPWGLYMGDFDGRAMSPRKVVDDGNVNSNANWSPDGSKLLFHRTVMGGPGWMTTAQVKPDGSGLHLVGGGYAASDEGGSAYWP